MARVTVSVTGIKGFTQRQLTIIKSLSSKQLEAIALETANRMKFHITSSIERQGSTGNLANAFFAERVSNLSWGIGRISYLNQAVPYWRWINFGVAGTGRRIPPGTEENPNIRGRFEPNQNGRFVKGYFPMNPKKAIRPHNYIQRTLNDQNLIISGVLQRIKS